MLAGGWGHALFLAPDNAKWQFASSEQVSKKAREWEQDGVPDTYGLLLH